MRKRSKTIVLAVGGLALLSTSFSAASAASAGQPCKTWKIGLEGPLTGSQSAVGIGMLNGAILAANNVNAHGGVLGRNVQIVPIDDAANAATGVAAATAAIKAGLDGIVGPYNSGVGGKTLPLYIKAKLVPIRLTSSTATEGLGVTLQPMESQIAPVAVTALTTWKKAKSVAVIYDSASPYTVGVSASVVTGLQAQGVTVTAQLPITEGQSDYTSVVTQALASHPDAVYAAVYYPEGGLIAQEMLSGSPTTTCLADYASASSGYAVAAGIPAAQNCPVLGVPAPNNFANSAGLVAAYTAAFKTQPGLWSPYTYDSLNLLVIAAAKAHNFQYVPLSKALFATTGFSGWTGPAAILSPSGNRTPAPVTVDSVDALGNLNVDLKWAAAVGYSS